MAQGESLKELLLQHSVERSTLICYLPYLMFETLWELLKLALTFAVAAAVVYVEFEMDQIDVVVVAVAATI